MAHPNKKEASDSHNRRLRAMTMDYGSASGPKNNILAPSNRLKGEGGEDIVGFGADSSAGRARGDRMPRRTQAANPVSTYKKGGRVHAKAKAKARADGGDVSTIEEANRDQAMASRARGGRTHHKGKGATHVNVIVAPQGGNQGPGAGMMPHPMMGANPAVPPPMPPVGGPPGMPPGMPPGGPMMGARPPMPMMPPGAIPPGMIPPRKRGGRVEHGDEAEDRAMIKQMVKGSALKNAGGRVGSLADQGLTKARARGGSIHMTAGAESGPGRLEKTEARRKNARSEHPQEV